VYHMWQRVTTDIDLPIYIQSK